MVQAVDHERIAASLRKPVWVALGMGVMILAFYAVREHWGHIAGRWPYLLLLACPLMHLWHAHGSHPSGSAHPGHSPDRLGSGG